MYPVSEKAKKEIDLRFSYHAPVPELDQAKRYEDIRSFAHDFAMELAESCPPSRELSTALTHLDSVVMFANAAIARNETAPTVAVPVVVDPSLN